MAECSSGDPSFRFDSRVATSVSLQLNLGDADAEQDSKNNENHHDFEVGKTGTGTMGRGLAFHRGQFFIFHRCINRHQALSDFDGT